MTCGIYCITHRETGRKYVGQSVNIENRFRLHQKHGRYFIGNAMRKYGAGAFDFNVIEECEEENLNTREEFWVDHLDTIAPSGFNLDTGGRYRKRSPAVGKKISASLKTSEKHKMKVHKNRTDEVVIERNRKIMEKNRQTPGFEEKRKAANAKTVNSPEHKERQRVMLRRMHKDPEWREKNARHMHNLHTDPELIERTNAGIRRAHKDPVKSKRRKDAAYKITADQSVYEIKNRKTLQTLTGTRKYFKDPMGFSHAGISDLVNGKREHYKQWVLQSVKSNAPGCFNGG